MSKDWSDILRPNETLLWQGRPRSGFVVTFQNILLVAGGVFFLGLASLMQWAAIQDGVGLLAPPAILGLVGLLMVAGPTVIAGYVRSKTWYSVTSQRAFIAKELAFVGKSFETYALMKGMRLEKHPRTSSIYFSFKSNVGQNGKARTTKTGFVNIDDFEKVWTLLESKKLGR